MYNFVYFYHTLNVTFYGNAQKRITMISFLKMYSSSFSSSSLFYSGCPHAFYSEELDKKVTGHA